MKFRYCTSCRSFFLVALVFFVGGSFWAGAAITLRLDIENKELSFFGNDTGTPLNLPDQGFVGWESADFAGFETGFSFNTFYTTITDYDDTVGQLYLSSVGVMIAVLVKSPPPIGEITITADPSRAFYYGDLTLEQIAILEAAVENHDNFIPVTGSGFSPMPTQVPEPGTTFLLAFGLLFVGLFFLKKRRN